MTPVLHHFPLSPFSEKIRLILGATGTDWQEVLLPVAPPRPSLDPVLGGYRRVPVTQIGADYYCDSKLIAHELSKRLDRSDLSPFDRNTRAAELIRRAEIDLFMPCLFSMPVFTTLRGYIQSLGFWGFVRFLRDRAVLARDFHMPALSRDQSRAAWQDWITHLNTQLATGWLEQKGPTITDFTVFHMIWFRNELTGSDCTRDFAHLNSWYESIKNVSGKATRSLSPEQSLDLARTCSPMADEAAGPSVSITPTDYARIATHGQLIEESSHHWTIARSTKAAGRIHVHFPKSGYKLTEISDETR